MNSSEIIKKLITIIFGLTVAISLSRVCLIQPNVINI